MTVEEATNRLVRAMKSAIEYHRKSISDTSDPVMDIFWALRRKDIEVESAFKDLIQAIMEEQDGH